MTFWEWLNARAQRRQTRWELRLLERAQVRAAGGGLMQRLRGPTERQGVTLGLFIGAGIMLAMAREDPKLWDVKLFEVTFQAIVLTGLLNMVTAFHFAANKGDEVKADNTGKAFDALKAQADALPPQPKQEPDVVLQPGETAQAEDQPKP